MQDLQLQHMGSSSLTRNRTWGPAALGAGSLSHWTIRESLQRDSSEVNSQASLVPKPSWGSRFTWSSLLSHPFMQPFWFPCVCVCVLAAQSCPTLCNPVECSPPGSSVHGLLQARILECVAILFSRGSSRPGDGILVSQIADRFFTI